MAENVNEECLAQIVIDALIGQQIPHVEKITRMLAVEGGDDLTGIEVGEADNLDFSKSKLLFDSGRNTSHRRFINAAAQDRCHLNLDLRPSASTSSLVTQFSPGSWMGLTRAPESLSGPAEQSDTSRHRSP